MRVSNFGSRAIGMGLVFALAGFSFAISTGLPPQSAAVNPRAVGSILPLRFANSNVASVNGKVFSPQEYDLGDACLGSTLTRYVIAEGGIRPYRFTSLGSLALANAISNTTSTLTLGLSGVLTGLAPNTIASNSKTVTGAPGIRFEVDITDANQTVRTGFFNLFLFDCNFVTFRFAMDTLPAARLDTPYITNIGVLGGRAPVTVSTLSVTNAATGQALALGDLGLFLGTDGTLYGRPLAVGTYFLGVRATDATKAIARSRRNTNNQDQVFTLTIADNPVTTSDTMTQECTVSGDTANTGRDTLMLRGLINVLGQDNFTLAHSDFSFQIGSIGFSGKLDKNGRFVQKNTDKSVFGVQINAKAGTIRISARQGSFISLFGLTGIKNGDTVSRPIKIVLADAVNSTEVINFVAKVSGTSYSFKFKQGSTGSNAAGGFQIVSVKGRDGAALTGQTGDAWSVGFVAQPRSGVTNPNGLTEGLNRVTALNIRVGTQFAQAFKGVSVSSTGKNISAKGVPTDGVQSFHFNLTSGKGTVNTAVLPTNSTGIPTAAAALKTANVYFPLGVDFTRAQGDATFTGEHARRIFGFGTRYTDHPSTRQGSPFK